jgi:hypothetical protein
LQDQVASPYAGIVPGSLGGATISRSQALKPYPYYTAVTARLPHLGSSIYHALLFTAERRLSNGVAVLASYTFGKLISDSAIVPSNFGAVEVGSDNGYQNGKYNRRINRSVDPDDVSSRAVVSVLYEIPFGRGHRYGGWQVNTIGAMQKGLPLILRGASNNLSDRPNSTGKSAKLDNPTRDGWFDTNQFINPPDFTYGNIGRVLPDVRTPGTVNWDLSLMKNTKITERVNLQFRAEAFNFLNHVNLGSPNVSFSAGADGKNRSGSFALITSARDARIGQLGLKVIF